jgi:molybdopterin-binding protein
MEAHLIRRKQMEATEGIEVLPTQTVSSSTKLETAVGYATVIGVALTAAQLSWNVGKSVYAWNKARKSKVIHLVETEK